MTTSRSPKHHPAEPADDRGHDGGASRRRAFLPGARPACRGRVPRPRRPGNARGRHAARHRQPASPEGGTDPGRLRSGTLFRPPSGPPRPAAPADYTIVRGDTISGIAGQFGLDTYAVLKLNNLQAEHHHLPRAEDQARRLGGRAGSPGTAAPAAAAPPAARRQRLHRQVRRHARAPSPPGTASGSPRSSAGTGSNMSSIIYPGQKIKVGGGRSRAGPAPHPLPHRPQPPLRPRAPASSGSYTIKAGDTLSGIAARNGVRLSDVLSANRLTMTSIIYPGQKLVIPGASTIAPASSTPAATTPLVPSTFLGLHLPGRRGQLGQPEQGAAQRLAGAQPRADEVDRGGHGPAHGRGRRPWPWPSPTRNPASTSVPCPRPTRSAPCRSSRPPANGPPTWWAAS